MIAMRNTMAWWINLIHLSCRLPTNSGNISEYRRAATGSTWLPYYTDQITTHWCRYTWTGPALWRPRVSTSARERRSHCQRMWASCLTTWLVATFIRTLLVLLSSFDPTNLKSISRRSILWDCGRGVHTRHEIPRQPDKVSALCVRW